MKRVILFAFALAVAAGASAQLSKYKDWAKSPESYFLTVSERADWANVKTDEDAEKFISGYYARRGGDKFRDEIARRIAAADQQFKLRRQRGAESPRGRLLIVLGTPSRVSSTRPQQEGGGASGDSGLNVRPDAGAGISSASPGAVTQTWMYNKDRFDPSWGVPELAARIIVDAARGNDELQNKTEVDRVLAIAADKSVINPGATAAAAPATGAVKPAVPPAATGAPAVAAPPAAAAPATAAIPAATRPLLDAVGKAGADAPGFWGGTFHSIPGDSFYAVELAAPADKAAAGTKFAGVVTSDAGQEVATFYEDAALTDAKVGPRMEKVYERSIVLPPGSYKGSFALIAPDGATTVVSGSSAFQIPAKGTEFEVSPLILASTLTPLGKRPAPTDPFVFGMEKPIRVDPKASRQFGKDESLWYFYTVSNPVVPASAAPAAAAPPPSATPAPGAPAAAAPAAAPEPKPRIMTRISVLRDGQPAFAPATQSAELQPLAPGYFATGTEIPLASFEPGFYTFSINVRDLNAPRDSAANKGIDRKQDFVVLKADGTMPEKKAPPTPAAKPKPPKK